jgi:hypothetical protein
LEPPLKWSEFKRLDLPLICIDARHARAVLKTLCVPKTSSVLIA